MFGGVVSFLCGRADTATKEQGLFIRSPEDPPEICEFGHNKLMAITFLTSPGTGPQEA